MNTTKQSAGKLSAPIKTEKKTVFLPEGMTQAKREKAEEKAAKREARKATNKAQTEATQSARDEKKLLSYQYKELQKHAQKFCVSLSLETGKDVSFESIRALKFKDFTPYITEREDAIFYGSWTFPRFLTIIKRYFRAEAKNALTAEQVAELSAIAEEINADVNAQ